MIIAIKKTKIKCRRLYYKVSYLLLCIRWVHRETRGGKLRKRFKFYALCEEECLDFPFHVYISSQTQYYTAKLRQPREALQFFAFPGATLTATLVFKDHWAHDQHDLAEGGNMV